MNIKYFIVCVLFVALSITAGCANKEVFRQEVQASRTDSYQRWLDEKQRDDETTSFIRGDLSILGALEIALLNNKSIRIAVEEKAKADGRLWQGYSEALPKLTGTASYRRLEYVPTTELTTFAPGAPGEMPQMTTIEVETGELDNYTAALELRQPLYRGGAISGAVRLAMIYGLVSEEQVRNAVEEVVYKVSKAYYDVKIAEKLHEVQQNALRSAQAHLEQVVNRKEAGVATEYDVLRAQVEVSNVKAEMVALSNRLNLTKAELLRLIGANQESEITLPSEMEYLPMEPVLNEAVRIAYENRSELQSAELNMRMQEEALDIAKSRRFPMLDAFFTNQWIKPGFGGQLGGGGDWDRRWETGLSLTWPIFDGLNREGRIAEEEAALRQSRLRIADAEEQIELQIRMALFNLRDAEELIETQALNIERAREGLRLAEVGYPDVTTAVEVIDARTALVQTEGFYWRAVHDHIIARLDLQRAMGILTPDPGIGEVPAAAPTPGVIPDFVAEDVDYEAMQINEGE